ncbi:MAG: PaaI family thioesterase [Thermodesulfobacteriota bacterium]
MTLSAEDLKAFVEKKIPFVERMGLRVLALRRGYVKLAAPYEGNENHIGTLYAGALFTLAEIPGGALFLTSFDAERFYPVVKEMTLRFLKPAITEVTVELSLADEDIARIQTEAEQAGKADFSLEGEIRDAHGDVVATSRGVYQIRKFKE